MVRADVFAHPKDWSHSGYQEIQNAPKRYAIIDLPALLELGGFNSIASLQKDLRQSISMTLKSNADEHQSFWPKSIAIGSLNYIDTLQTELGIRAIRRPCIFENTHLITLILMPKRLV